MAAGDRDEAIAALLAADRLETPGLRTLLAQPAFAPIAGDARLAGIAERPAA